MAFAELAVHQLIRNETEHLSVAYMGIDEIHVVLGSLGDPLPRAKLDQSRTKVDDENLDGSSRWTWATTAATRNILIGEYLCIWVDYDEAVFFCDDFDGCLDVRWYFYSFRNLDLCDYRPSPPVGVGSSSLRREKADCVQRGWLTMGTIELMSI